MKTYLKKTTLLLLLFLCFSFSIAFSLEKYTNGEGNYQISYDILLWEIETSGPNAILKIIPERIVPQHKFNESASIMIYASFGGKDLDYTTLADSARQTIRQAWPDPEIISQKKVVLDKIEAAEFVFISVDQSGQKAKVKQYFLNKKGYLYMIVAVADVRDFSAVESAFDKVISLFKTLK